MKRVLGVSLGSSDRDSSAELEFLGHQFLVQRIGTDGDKAKFERLMTENDGKVDALCFGGGDLYLYAANRRYPFKAAHRLVRNVRQTPVVDGGGIKHALEAATVGWMQSEGLVDFSRSNVLLVCAVDRYGLAWALARLCRRVVFGDVMFGLGLPFPLTSIGQLNLAARILLPIITRLPLHWVYPTGSRQRSIVPKWGKYYQWADVIAGDFLFIRRHLPDRLAGKVIVTNTTTAADVDLLRQRGVRLLVTSTPCIGGRTFGTNILEGMLVAAAGASHPLSEGEYLAALRQAGWKPTVQHLEG